MANKILHFTLGPVQGFVAQARRTRDLWGGSFLLSWLSGQAMRAVLDAGGQIVFPRVCDANGAPNDPLLQAIICADAAPASIGSLPNRFKAIIPDDFDPRRCRDEVLMAWEKLAQVVYQTYIEPLVDDDSPTAAIWRRQVSGFWEIAWVSEGDSGDGRDNAWLDARKNWRSHRPPEEGGDHCTIMGDWQELSGFFRSRDSRAQDEFWQRLRRQPDIGALDLRPGERLCAIALVKRLFPKVAEKAIGWSLDTVNWPSTSYMAAVPWIKEAWNSVGEQALDYPASLKAAGAEGVYGERATRITGLEHVPTRFRGLDGRLYHPHLMESALLEQGIEDKDIVSALKRLHEITRKKSGTVISNFYALLLMDGDRLGALLRTLPPEVVSEALGRFTQRVPAIVSANNGVTIYAGGDDVLALLPMPDALQAAEALNAAYREQFSGQAGATLSGAIVYAHQTLPLLDVLAEAHHQLDVVAKERNGRNSLAISVLKGGSRNCQWVVRWPQSGEINVLQVLRELVEEFSSRPEFSNRMLYVLRDRFGRLLDEQSRFPTGLDANKLLVAEFMTNGIEKYSLEMATLQADQLLQICRYRTASPEVDKNWRMQPDGALLVRFLAAKGRDE